MIEELCESVHKLLPAAGAQTLDHHYVNAIISAIALVECAVTNAKECTFTSNTFADYPRHTMTITADNSTINNLLEKLHDNFALFQLNSVQNNINRGMLTSVCCFVFSDIKTLNKEGGITLPKHINSERSSAYYEHINNLSLPLGELILDLLYVDQLTAMVSTDALRWFVDRLPQNEIRGPHMLALQNFLYRRAK